MRIGASSAIARRSSSPVTSTSASPSIAVASTHRSALPRSLIGLRATRRLLKVQLQPVVSGQLRGCIDRRISAFYHFDSLPSRNIQRVPVPGNDKSSARGSRRCKEDVVSRIHAHGSWQWSALPNLVRFNNRLASHCYDAGHSPEYSYGRRRVTATDRSAAEKSGVHSGSNRTASTVRSRRLLLPEACISVGHRLRSKKNLGGF